MNVEEPLVDFVEMIFPRPLNPGGPVVLPLSVIELVLLETDASPCLFSEFSRFGDALVYRRSFLCVS